MNAGQKTRGAGGLGKKPRPRTSIGMGSMAPGRQRLTSSASLRLGPSREDKLWFVMCKLRAGLQCKAGAGLEGVGAIEPGRAGGRLPRQIDAGEQAHDRSYNCRTEVIAGAMAEWADRIPLRRLVGLRPRPAAGVLRAAHGGSGARTAGQGSWCTARRPGESWRRKPNLAARTGRRTPGTADRGHGCCLDLRGTLTSISSTGCTEALNLGGGAGGTPGVRCCIRALEPLAGIGVICGSGVRRPRRIGDLTDGRES